MSLGANAVAWACELIDAMPAGQLDELRARLVEPALAVAVRERERERERELTALPDGG